MCKSEPQTVEAEVVTPTEETVLAAPSEPMKITPLTMLEGARASGASPEAMKQFMDLYERWEDRKAETAFKEAMARVQELIPVVVATSENAQTKSKYAKEAEISKAIKPIYTKEGFSLGFYQGECQALGHMRIMADVAHKDGHTVTRHIDYPYDQAGIAGKVNKTPIHAYKSTFTYGRSTLTCAIFNVATGVGDDDGNAAGDDSLITDEQALELALKLDEIGGDLKGFVANFKVERLEDIPASQLQNAINMIAARKAFKERQAQCPS